MFVRLIVVDEGVEETWTRKQQSKVQGGNNEDIYCNNNIQSNTKRDRTEIMRSWQWLAMKEDRDLVKSSCLFIAALKEV